jgi:hypothetical protein
MKYTCEKCLSFVSHHEKDENSDGTCFELMAEVMATDTCPFFKSINETDLDTSIPR